MTQPDLSIVIVSWNVREQLLACLTALPDAISADYSYEIVVVDNASDDGTADAIQRAHPTVRLIANARNRLYTAAANQGLDATRGRHLLVLNPDTLSHPASFARLIAYADAHPAAGLLGPRILDAESNDDLLTARYYPTLWSETLAWLGVTRRMSRHRLLSANLRPAYDRSRTSPAPLLSGACMLLTQALPSDLRRFDSGFIMYGEDVDLCRRIQTAGYETVLVAEAVIVHAGGESSRQDAARAAVLAADGVNRYFRRWHGAGAAVAHRAIMAGIAAGKWLAFSLLGFVGREPNPALQRRLHEDVLRWAVVGRVSSRVAPE